MKSYKDPSFQDRIGRAAEAKRKALDQLKAKPAPDEAVLAERAAAHQAREAAAAAKRAEKKAREAAAAEAERSKPADPPAPTEAELKAARDARYAARKNRK